MAQPQKEPLRAMSEQEEREALYGGSAGSRLEEWKGSGQAGEAFQYPRLSGPVDHRRTRTQADVHERAACSHPGPSAAGAGSRTGSERDLVAAVAADSAAQGGAAPRGPRNDSPGAARGGL